jgi:transposase
MVTAIESIAEKIGCVPQTLHEWVKKAEINSGKRPGIPEDMAERMKALERKVRELRQGEAFKETAIKAVSSRTRSCARLPHISPVLDQDSAELDRPFRK